MAFMKIVVSAFLVAAVAARPQLSGLAAIDEPEDTYPVYTYAYQVASDERQTYIAKEESRDGDNVNGEYSYVDPLGNLVTVTYTAGAMGYSEERNVQPNFVTIRAGNVGAAATTANSGVISEVIQQIRPAVQNVVSKTTSSSTSGESDSDVVARIIAQLTPFIRTTVSGSLGGSSSSTSSSAAGGSSATRTTTTTSSSGTASAAPAAVQTVRRVVTTQQAAAPVQTTRTVVSSSAPAASAVTSIFGVEGSNNVQFSTPEFDFAYDLQK